MAHANAESRPKIAAQLARHGYAVVQTATVEQTLSAARNDPQAILLDTALDGMNGWEILPLLRRMDSSARTPVLLLSVEDPENPKQLPAAPTGGFRSPFRKMLLLTELARVLCGTGEKARILIVEDDHGPREYHQRSLRP
ncbi:MAG: response regulator [Terracidiphilus sp.]